MTILIAAIALAVALVLQAALSLVGPSLAHVFDPFTIVVVYFALRHGETAGMLAGAAAGWLQDLHFAGPVVGVSALSKVLVGFAVGFAGSRLLLTGAWERLLVVLGAALLDTLLFERLLSLFDLPAEPVGIATLMLRATITALIAATIFGLLDRRVFAKGR